MLAKRKRPARFDRPFCFAQSPHGLSLFPALILQTVTQKSPVCFASCSRHAFEGIHISNYAYLVHSEAALPGSDLTLRGESCFFALFQFTSAGVDFLVMEYIPGTTLSEKFAGRPLPEKEVIRLGTQLAEGLSAAHEHGPHSIQELSLVSQERASPLSVWAALSFKVHAFFEPTLRRAVFCGSRTDSPAHR